VGLRPVAACGTSPPPGGAGLSMALRQGQAIVALPRRRSRHLPRMAYKRSSRCRGADARNWAIASARHGRRRVALPVERERPAAGAAAARSARIHQSASQRPNACRRQRTAPRASAQRVAGGACKERVVWLTPGRRPAARASQTRSRPTGGGSPGWSANQGSHEPTPTAFLSVERRANDDPRGQPLPDQPQDPSCPQSDALRLSGAFREVRLAEGVLHSG
jgi:hypothetical protein